MPLLQEMHVVCVCVCVCSGVCLMERVNHSWKLEVSFVYGDLKEALPLC